MANEINLVHKRQFFKNAAQGGGVAAGAKMFAYAQGSSSTTLDTYSDEGLTTPNANFLTADSNGRFGAVYGSQSPYHIIVTDAAGNTLADDDGVMRNKTRIKASALPSVHWADMEVYLTSDGHLYERAHDDLSWIDRGPIDGAGNLSTIAETIALTNATHTVTPSTLFGLMGLSAVAITAGSSIILDSGGGKLFVINGASTTINTINTSTDAREILLFFATAQKLGNGSGIVTPNSVTLECPANSFVRLIRYNSTWIVLGQAQCGQRLVYLGTQRFTATGTYTRTAGCILAFARTVGPGASGGTSDNGTASNGSAGGGGGSGAYIEEWIAPSATETVTIGTGGAAQATANTAGNPGSGPSSFGAFHSAAAGAAGAAMANGTAGAAAAGGAGGAATNGGLNVDGGKGGYAYRAGGGAGHAISGEGGSNPLGKGGAPVCGSSAAVAGNPGTGYGSGGSGSSVNGNTVASPSGAGQNGICIVDEYGII